MHTGKYRISQYVADRFRLDGGAMFGSVPKVLWSRKIAADEQNRIQLACRVLVVEGQGERILVDVGMGRKWSEKEVGIFAIEYGLAGQIHEVVPDVTAVVLTHMHFDHAGGVSYRDKADNLKLAFPKARHFLQRANYEIARHPGLRYRASNMKENIEPLSEAQRTLTSDGERILPGVSVHVSNGHTQGLQWVLIDTGVDRFVYPADLMPTSHHLGIPWVMGYDLCAETAMREKEQFIRRAVDENWIIVFEHDPVVAAARIAYDAKGTPVMAEQVTLPEWGKQ